MSPTLIIQDENQTRYSKQLGRSVAKSRRGCTCSMHYPITPLPVAVLAIATLLPINSAPGSRQRVPDLVRARGRRDGPRELERAARGLAGGLLLVVLVAALEGAPAVGLLLLLRAAAAVDRVPGARERVADLACSGL